MWFLVVTRQLSCFSAFADLHGLSSLTCCFYEYIRADAVNRFDLATQPCDIFFLYSFSKINFGRWPELTCGHWHQPRFWFQFELQFCSWFCCTTMIFFSAYIYIYIFLWFWSRFDSIQSVCTITTRQLLWIQLWSGASTFDHWHAACSFIPCCTLSFGLLWSWFCLKGFWLGYLHLFLLSKSPNLLLAWGGIDVHVW